WPPWQPRPQTCCPGAAPRRR
ncbi:MAG: hypothetical protein AVDCRST_MAG35-2622, partial [uncultured Quadrisphaera sp.]